MLETFSCFLKAAKNTIRAGAKQLFIPFKDNESTEDAETVNTRPIVMMRPMLLKGVGENCQLPLSAEPRIKVLFLEKEAHKVR